MDSYFEYVLNARYLVVTILIAIISSILIYNNLISTLNPFGWDEAYRANPSLAIERDILRGDIGAFIEDSNRQMFYPPGSSWIIGLLFIIFGESAIAARLMGLVFYGASVVLIYMLTKTVTKKDTPLNLVPSVLLATSPFILLFAALSMLETAGMFFTILIFYLYSKALETGNARLYFLTGLAGATAFMVKYNYGITPMAALLLAEGFAKMKVSELNPKNFAKNVFTKNNLIMFLTMAVICAIWLSSIVKLLEFGNAILNRGYDTRQPVTFYMTSLGFYTFSPLLYVIIIMGTLYAYRHIRDEKIKHMLIFCSMMLVLLTLHNNKIVRLLITVAPIMFVLVIYSISKNFSRMNKALGKNYKPILFAFVVITAISMPTIANTIQFINSRDAPIGWAVMEKDESINGALDFIYSETRDFNTDEGCVFGGFNELGFHLIYWHHNVQSDKKPRPFPDFCRPKFLGTSFSYGVSAEYVPAYAAYLDNLLENSRIKYVVAIELNTTSKYYTAPNANYGQWEINYVRLMENRTDFDLSARKAFNAAAVRIYRRR